MRRKRDSPEAQARFSSASPSQALSGQVRNLHIISWIFLDCQIHCNVIERIAELEKLFCLLSDLLCSPPPQETVHSPQSPQLLHTPGKTLKTISILSKV